jgi:hypothetical protein
MDSEIEMINGVVTSMNDDLKNMLEHEYPKLGITYMTLEQGIKYYNYPDGRKEVVSNKDKK